MTSPIPSRGELPIIQAAIDLIRWYLPLLNGLPRTHKFGLGDRLVPPRRVCGDEDPWSLARGPWTSPAMQRKSSGKVVTTYPTDERTVINRQGGGRWRFPSN